MDIRDLPVCSGCGANIRQGEDCLNCGSSLNLTDAENSQNDVKLTDQPSVGFVAHNTSVRSGINSLFDRLIPADADLLSSGHEVNSSISEKKISKLKIAFTSVLALIFLSFLSVNVYALVIKSMFMLSR
ncbi:hypothetical protein LDC_0444 [sediment metagenome]|uniref:Uncharacterized protein n=1 Tax=sediment metagenome TaxID=749907 RepID=D9PFZ9_9ZZZZ